MSDDQRRQAIQAYRASASFMDAQVGIVLRTLDVLRLADRTIVVLLSDHGYHLGEHGGLWHKLSLFEESARVPFVIYSPQMKAKGQPCERLVEMIDLYPTLVSLCHLPRREGLDGIDLSRLLDDPTGPSKPAAYTVVSRTNDPSANQSQKMDYLGRSIRTDRWRYTEWDGGKRGVELYDHAQDPHEWNNLAADSQYASMIHKLHDQLVATAKSAAETL